MQPIRRQQQHWRIAKRRLRKMLKLFRVQFMYNYNRIRMLVVIVSLVTAFFVLYKSSTGDRDEDTLAVGAKTSFLLPNQSREDILLEETKLSLRHVCERKNLENNVEELRFCGKFKRKGGKKIVGLVEVRNVEASITPFLSALGEVVDSVVIVDDHSTDGSRLQILRHSLIDTNGKPLVEVLLNKTGEWTREELFDRELLLSTARRVGGTHFILLDYDEYLSANCVKHDFLRKHILQLSPGESLYLPWVELWKSHKLQRVLPQDPNMNFLTRRQTVIFADDGTSHYTKESSAARLLGSHERNSTLHVLRCPRTICPKPLKYKGAHSDISGDSRVKRLPQCAIVEMRFLNMENVLLKSAWYEALGRVTGAEDGVTSGKMINLLFPNRNISPKETYRLEAVDPKFLGKHALAGAQSMEGIEMWRAEDLLTWMDFRGKSTFADLRSLNLIDVDELRNVLHQARSDPGGVTYRVPRRKEGVLLVVYETSVGVLIRKLLSQFEFSEVEFNYVADRYPEGVRLGVTGSNAVQYEQWKTEVMVTIYSALRKSITNRAFLVIPGHSDSLSLTFLDLVHREVADANVVILRTSSTSSVSDDNVSVKAKAFAQQRGSHIQFINFPIENFGSYSTVHWLVSRLSTGAEKSNGTEAQERSILDFVEALHVEDRQKRLNPGSPRYAPVGKLIFCLNFGRSGSKYLADLIGTTRGLVFSQHEPLCPHNGCSGGGALRMQNKSLVNSYEERKALKLPMIRQSITNLSQTTEKLFESRTIDCQAPTVLNAVDKRLGDGGNSYPKQHPIFEINSRAGCVVHIVRDAVYAETNPNFKSWIYDISLDFFPRAGYDVRVMVLRKYVAALLKSLYETGYFTVRDGYNWMETSAGVNSKVKVPSLQNDSLLDEYGKILSYLVNSEARFRHIIQDYSDRKSAPQFLEMRSERLYSVEGTMEALEWLGLELTERTSSLAGSVRDKYVDGSSKKRKTISLFESEKRVNKFVESMRGEEARILRDLLRPLDRIDDYEYPV